MPKITILDVTGYARLWRLHWWTWRLLFLTCVPLLMMVGIIVYLHLTGEMNRSFAEEVSEIAANAKLSADAKAKAIQAKQSDLADINGFFAANLHYVVAAYAGTTVLMLAYFGIAGKFSWRASHLGLALIAVMLATFVMLGWPHIDRLMANGSKGAYEGLSLVVLVLATPFLVSQSALLTLLGMHRLSATHPPTTTMTRSLASSLKFSLPSLSGFTPLGFAVQAGVCLVGAAILALFPTWTAKALAVGLASLSIQIAQFIQVGSHAVVKLLTGETALTSADIAKLRWGMEDIGQFFVVMAGILLATAAWRYGMRLNRRRRDEIILTTKPPILLLRSFVDDVAGIKPNNIILRLFRRRKRLEECLGEELAAAGPFVAVGKPGESLPPLGALRLYLADDKWQGVVKSYIDRAELIILIAGKTRWVRWELSSILQQSRLERLLIVFPPLPRAERAQRWDNLKAAFDGTPWQQAAAGLDIAHTLMIFPTRDGGLVQMHGRSGSESDYEAAFRVATYQMRGDA